MKNIKFKFCILFLLLLATFLSCEDNNPVDEQLDLRDVSGKVYQPFFTSHVPVPNVRIIFDEYETVSDSTGSFKITVPLGEYQPVCIHPAGDSLTNVLINIRKDRTVDLFIIGPTVKVSGIVYKENLVPFDSVLVTLHTKAIYTDENGYYEFLDVPSAVIQISFNKEYYAEIIEVLNIPYQDLTKNYELTKNRFRVSGVVSSSSSGLLDNVLVSMDQQTSSTDSNGTFMFIGVPSGEYNISFSKQYYENLEDIYFVPSADTSFEISLTKNRFSVNGLVSNSSSGLLENVLVSMNGQTSLTDSNGFFLFIGVPSGEYNISFSKQYYENLEDRYFVPSADTSFDINLIKSEYTFSGTVYHESDGLIEGVEVIIDSVYYDTTDINGEFLFSELYGGEHYYQCTKENYTSLSGTFITDELVKNVNLRTYKLLTDTLWLEQDSYIRQDWYVDTTGDNNYNFENILITHHSQRTGYLGEPGQSPWMVIYYSNSMICLLLPELNSIESDSVLLSLTSVRNYGYPYNIAVANFDDTWIDSQITWNNRPNLGRYTQDLILNIMNNNKFYINISDPNHALRGEFGGILDLTDIYCDTYETYCSFSYSFHSSEADDINNRPMVIIYSKE